MALALKNLPANAGDIRDAGLIPGLGRSPEEVSGNPLQYSCLENPVDRGTWRATVYKIAKSQTWPKWLSTRTCPILKQVGSKISLHNRKDKKCDICEQPVDDDNQNA